MRTSNPDVDAKLPTEPGVLMTLSDGAETATAAQARATYVFVRWPDRWRRNRSNDLRSVESTASVASKPSQTASEARRVMMQMRVLVVEDDPDVAESVRHALVARGISVELSTDGSAALLRIAADAFDA